MPKIVSYKYIAHYINIKHKTANYTDIEQEVSKCQKLITSTFDDRNY